MPRVRPINPAQIRDFEQAIGRPLARDVPLAPLTTFGVGGPADCLLETRGADDLADAVRAARQLDIDYLLLGCGANLLVGDRGHPGLVIRNAGGSISVTDHRLIADSGATMYPDVIDAAVHRGLSGLEHYVGIPSTVGGALWQNLHFLSPPPERDRTMFIAEVLESARLLTAEGECREVGVDYFRFGYDYSVLHDRDDIVLSATFALSPADPIRLREIMAANLAWRSQRHPPLDTQPSAGSIFRKIEGIGAGRLIDECGLKGLSCGGAQISPRHANIIINRGGATAADICALIMHAQRVVSAQTGYWLTPEIGFVGEFAPVKRLPADARAV